MKNITEPKRKIKVSGNYDVVVAGGGPAGIAAAVAAARNGAKTIIIEQTGSLGGMGTNGLVPFFCDFSRSNDYTAKGIGYEIFKKLLDLKGTEENDWPFIDPELLKYIYDNIMKESKVKVLFYTSFAAVIKEKDKIKGIIIENKDGRQAITGKVFIDATGDADIAYRAGVPCRKGGKKGELQAVSVCFNLLGIDYKTISKKFFAKKKWNEFLRKAEAKGMLSSTKDSEYVISGVKPIKPVEDGFMGFNFGHVFNIDGTKTEDLTYAMIRGREIAHEFVRFGKKHIPGMKNARLATVAPLVGVRETRRIEGEYTLNVDDYINARRFQDNIAVFAFPVDVHATDKSGKDHKRSLKQHTEMRLPHGKCCGIPYRSLLPLKINNLIVAGRSLSADRLTQGAARVMPICFSMGEAAGTASAISIKDKVGLKQVDIMKLQDQLIKQGARVY